MASKIPLDLENLQIDSTECSICAKKMDDPLLFGAKMTKSNITVHYFCLLLSTNLQQKGKDADGILGFLINDIKREINAAKARSCIYCGENGATIQCGHITKKKTCQTYFHLICGFANYTQHEFIDEFKSYCHKHIKIIVDKKHNTNTTCRICYESMNAFNAINSIKGNCCGYGWVHSKCLKKYALTGGYYLKCLWCRNPKFRDQVRRQGIFVPDRDAAWELDNTNFAGLYERYKNCDATVCVCPHGRTFNKQTKNKDDWQLLTCYTCGASGIHKKCYNSKDTKFTCNNCLDVFKKTILPNSKISPRKLVDNHLEVTTPFDQKNLDDTLFVEKINQDRNNDELGEFFQDCGPSVLQKLIKYDPKTNQVVAVVHAKVDNPHKQKYNYNEIEIVKEVNANTKFTVPKDLIWKYYKEVLEEEEQKKILNGGNSIVVYDSDDDAEKTTSDLLDEIMNKPTEQMVPKPKELKKN